MTIGKLAKINTWVLQAVATAICWTILYKINWVVFKFIETAPGVNLIFLPAMIRVVAALMFGVPGAIGLGLGCLITMGETHPDHNVVKIALDLIINTVGPFIAVYMGKQVMQIPETLSGINHKHILIFSILVAACNSWLHWFRYQITENTISMNGAGISMFIGDVLGAVIMLYGLSLVMRLFQNRNLV